MPEARIGINKFTHFYNIQRLHSSLEYKTPDEIYYNIITEVMFLANPIEAFNRGVREITKNKTPFRTDESLFKILYLASIDILEKWTMPIQNWSLIFNQLMIEFEVSIYPASMNFCSINIF